jgi:hypothetical protein
MPSFLPYFTPLAPVFVPHTLPALALLPAPFPNVLSPFSNPATAREIEEATTVSSSNMHSLSSPASSSSTPISVHESEADEEEREIEALLRSCFEKPSAFVLPTSVPILDNCAPNPEWLWVLFHHLNEEFPYFMPSSDAFRACMRAHPALHELLEPLADLLDMNLDEAPQKHTYFLSREAKLSLAYRKYLPLAPLHIHILHFFLNFKREIDELCQTHHIGLTDALEVSLLALEQIDKRVIYRNESELHLSREYTSVFHALTFFMHRLVHEHRKAQCIFTKQVIGLL